MTFETEISKEEVSKTEKSPVKIKKEKFDKQFPTFKGMAIYKNQTISLIAWDINGEYYSEDFLMKYCLDKKRVREVIHRIGTDPKIEERDVVDLILKELNLEDDKIDRSKKDRKTE